MGITFAIPVAALLGFVASFVYYDIKGEYTIPLKTRIKELREKKQLTQEQLAKKVGVRRETILFLEIVAMIVQSILLGACCPDFIEISDIFMRADAHYRSKICPASGGAE